MKTKNNTNRIVWEKWYDPLGEDDLESVEVKQITSDDIPPTFYDDHGDEIDNNAIANHEPYKKPLKIIVTPMGIIPYTENTASNKIFNFWVGHTNFNLTNFICELIENSEGVETLDIFTRYRFRIGIGKLFDVKTTISQIDHLIYKHLLDLEQSSNG